MFSASFAETFLILRRSERDKIKKICIVLKYCGRYSCEIFMKLRFCLQIFEKLSNIKFPEKLASENRVVTWRRTDRRDEA